MAVLPRCPTNRARKTWECGHPTSRQYFALGVIGGRKVSVCGSELTVGWQCSSSRATYICGNELELCELAMS